MTASEGLAPIRVVIDTSAVMPILTGSEPGHNWLCQLWQCRRILPLINSETRQELEAKIERSPSANENKARLFAQAKMRLYRPYCAELPLQPVLDAPMCRDPNDQMFIELAIAGAAHFLISRDDDLLAMDTILKLPVLHDQNSEARSTLIQAATTKVCR